MDYSPKFKPGADITLTASADILGGQLVVVSGVNAVAPSEDAIASWAGVARQDAAVGELVVVTRGGVQQLTVGGDVAAGDQVVGAADGLVVAIGGAPLTTVVGIALSAAADQGTASVLMAR